MQPVLESRWREHVRGCGHGTSGGLSWEIEMWVGVGHQHTWGRPQVTQVRSPVEGGRREEEEKRKGGGRREGGREVEEGRRREVG